MPDGVAQLGTAPVRPSRTWGVEGRVVAAAGWAMEMAVVAKAGGRVVVAAGWAREMAEARAGGRVGEAVVARAVARAGGCAARMRAVDEDLAMSVVGAL